MPEPDAHDADGWRVVQLAVVLRSLENANDRALTPLSRFDEELEEGTRETIERDRLLHVKTDVREIVHLASIAEQLIDTLDDEAIEIDYANVARAAARELAEGMILDVERVRLVASLVGVQEGLATFATCLRESDVHTAWEGATITDLLGSIRGVTPQLVRRIATAAGLAPGMELAACEPDEVGRLATQIETYLLGQR